MHYIGTLATRHWQRSGCHYNCSETKLEQAIYEKDAKGRIINVAHPSDFVEGTRWEASGEGVLSPQRAGILRKRYTRIAKTMPIPEGSDKLFFFATGVGGHLGRVIIETSGKKSVTVFCLEISRVATHRRDSTKFYEIEEITVEAAKRMVRKAHLVRPLRGKNGEPFYIATSFAATKADTAAQKRANDQRRATFVVRFQSPEGQEA